MTFTNQSTIQGSGNIGDGHMALNKFWNDDANQPAGLVLQISNGATLMVLGGTYTNTGAGTFLAAGTNSQVVLDGRTVTETNGSIARSVAP